MKKFLFCCILASLMLTACSSAPPADDAAASVSSEEQTAAPAVPDAAPSDADTPGLGALTALIGRADADVAGSLGGGAENWTSDRAFFIGRIYDARLLDADVKVYTVCADSDAHEVQAVSVWVHDGQTPVPDGLLTAWQNALTEHTGVQITDSGISAESGSHGWYWHTGDFIFSLRQLGDIVTLDINPAIGELL
ncbi:hypothetical protein JQM60_01575 [Butyricicoccus pullicaecorum]|nr:hypothetical protein [Butyricicoccus pullicaecorum]